MDVKKNIAPDVADDGAWVNIFIKAGEYSISILSCKESDDTKVLLDLAMNQIEKLSKKIAYPPGSNGDVV